MYPKLPRIEVYLYFLTWILGVGYAIYQVYLVGNEYHFSSFVYSFDLEWSFLGRRYDASDNEWTVWVYFTPKLLPWIFVQIVVSEIIRWKNPIFLSLWYFIISVTFLSFAFGPILTLLFILEPCIIYVSALMGSRHIVWIISMATLVGFNYFVIGINWIGLDVAYEVKYLAIISMAWNILRAISFCLDNLSDLHPSSLFCFLGYCFYLPVLIFGPVILYDKFSNALTKPFTKWTLRRMGKILFELTRFFGWAFVTEMCLHYFYFSTMQRMPEFVWELKPWALYGMGYCMGQFFMMKYTAIYGVGATFARVEQIDAPHHPKCIGRIHLYSNMWRYFDRGLYFFIAKYIYIPCLGNHPFLLRKLMASSVCFAFVFVWHGLYLNILIWSALNFLGVSVEGMCKAVGSTATYQRCESQFLSKENSRRFKALISIPLFIMAAISNFYFFAGYDVGNIYFGRLFSGSLLANSTLLFFCYCNCQVSIEVSNWEEVKQKKACARVND